MVKKFSFVLVFLTALIIVGGNNPAEAKEVYIGSYSDGTAVYLMTETIKERNYSDSVHYWCKVRAGHDYLNYEFMWVKGLRGVGGGYWYYSNSEGYSGEVYDGNSPIAAAILNYIRK